MTRLVRAVPHAEPGTLESFALSMRGVRRARLTPEWGLAIGARRAPIRIQRRRTKGWRMPDGAVYVGRPSGWGNPYRVVLVRRSGPFDVVGAMGFVAQTTGREQAAEIAVKRFTYAVDMGWHGLPTPAEIRAKLAGRDLACWCRLDQPCHADVLLRIANTPVECTPWERCRWCRTAARCSADGQHAAAHAFLLQARDHHGEVGHVPDPPTPRAVGL